MANVHVKVPQKDGEVSISFAGDEPRTFRVTDGQVSVPEADVARFVAAVKGSSVVGGSPSDSPKEK